MLEDPIFDDEEDESLHTITYLRDDIDIGEYGISQMWSVLRGMGGSSAMDTQGREDHNDLGAKHHVKLEDVPRLRLQKEWTWTWF